MKRLFFILFLIPGLVTAQNFKLSDKIDLEIFGTSTLHDWEMVSETGNGRAIFEIENGELKDINSLSFVVATKTLKSGKSPMDKICYESMKADAHENITFNLKDITSIVKSGTTYKITGQGTLNIAGKMNPAQITVLARVQNNSVSFEGEYDLKMTQFNVDPPTAMFGTIRTGDEIKVKFTVKYESVSSS